MIHQIRVIFGDTDQMGVVYYGNYLRFFEASRAALWRGLGRTHEELDAWGVALPVIEAHCRYRRPAHYEDLLDVHIHISDVGMASITFEYRVTRGGETLAEGYTRHAIVDGKGRPRRMPAELRQSIDQAMSLPPDTMVT